MFQFRISKLFGLSVQVDGIALVDENGIQLAIHEPKEGERLWDAEVESVKIDWDNLARLEIDYGMLGHRVIIHVNSTDALVRLPGMDGNRVELAVRRQDREPLEEFERRASEYQSGQRRDNVDDLLDDVRGFLDNL